MDAIGPQRVALCEPHAARSGRHRALPAVFADELFGLGKHFSGEELLLPGLQLAERVARAAPNGHTIYIHHMGMATAPALYKKLSFDPLKDFEYIGQVVDVPMTLLARKDFPANNYAEMVAYIKANKDKVSLANAGLGAVSHLCGLLFQTQIEVDLNTIPYKGTGPAMNDLLGGQVDLLCDQTTQTVPMIKEGRVKVYGVTTLSDGGVHLCCQPLVPVAWADP